MQARANARSARRRAREFALQGVYAWLLRGGEGTQDAGEIDAHLRDAEDFSEADAQWFKTLLHGVLREAPVLRERFLPYIDRPLAELSPVEHGILLIGSFELMHHVEVPGQTRCAGLRISGYRHNAPSKLPFTRRNAFMPL
ncbi:NusB family protein [Bordetella bronchiseptica D993]|uniref:transcription antitermination factor NusB n=1 Tax=Bordetella bronchiseptica TaxID=518 RepID=UPI000461DE78|nr:transcription antitermination factor NusB [Bordetella bronchiseptica]KDB91854.1 NusB family protein [Bordetella bronchiseptica D993]